MSVTLDSPVKQEQDTFYSTTHNHQNNTLPPPPPQPTPPPIVNETPIIYSSSSDVNGADQNDILNMTYVQPPLPTFNTSSSMILDNSLINNKTLNDNHINNIINKDHHYVVNDVSHVYKTENEIRLENEVILVIIKNKIYLFY